MFKRSLFLIAFSITSVFGFSQQGNGWCGTDKILQDLKANNPGFTEHMHKSMSKASLGGSAVQKSLLSVPVVVHIIHDNGVGNISDEQVMDALNILNQDYNRQNPDTTNTRNTATAPFKPQAGVMDIEFILAKIDPDGNCTNGIVRVNAPDLTYNAGDDCKYSSLGGSDQWPMDKYLNIWVVNSIDSDGSVGTILGYAYLPYWPNGANYGILIRNDAFGTIETAFNSDGRTLTHEMGHLLGLQHIFDAGWSGSTGCHSADCNQNGDYCCDTPPQAEANWSCSSIWNSCAEVPVNDEYGFDAVDQIENYMSYNYCQNMFSRDQAAMMQQNFIDIDFMASIVTPQNADATGIFVPDVLCKAEFDVSKQQVCGNDFVQFTDYSFHNPVAWTWSVAPGTINVDWEFISGTDANSQNPVIKFYTEGEYQITLIASDGVTSDTEIKDQYITVLPDALTIPFWEGFENLSTFTGAENWMVYNPQNNNTFVIDQTTGNTGTHCAKLGNFGQSGSNSDELISTAVDLSVVDQLTESVTLSFRYAYRKRYESNDEWLKVFISGNCGEDWVQRKTIHGTQLSTEIVSTAWTPSSQSDWVTVHVTNITSSYFVENFRYKFEFEGNAGNNFYLDDINIYKGSPSNTVVLGIAEEGNIAELSLYPNPTEDEINLRFSLSSDQLTTLQINDITGKEMESFVINAKSGLNEVLLGSDKLAAGVYYLTVNAGGSQSTLQFIVK